MSIGETTTRFCSSSPPSRNGWNIGGRTSPGPCPPPLVLGEPRVDPRDELGVAHPQVVVGDPPAAGHDVERELQRLLVDVLARGSRTTPGWPAPRAGWTARPAGARPRTPRARPSRSGSSCRQAASASASSIASLVPEPIEKCAVCAASPSSTTLPWRQRSLRTVVKLIHRELLASTSCPSSTSANSSRDPLDRRLVGLARRERPVGERRRSRPRSHTSSCISTMNVLPCRVERVAVDLHHAVRRLARCRT